MLRWLFRALRLYGDIRAAGRGRLGRRLVRRAAWRTTGRLLRKLFR